MMKNITLFLFILSFCLRIDVLIANNNNILNTEKDSVNINLESDSKLEIIENNIVIRWNVMSSKSFQGFEIERSKDRKNWKKVGFVPFQKNTCNYKFIDSIGSSSPKYYRIKRVQSDDLDKKINIIAELETAVQGRAFSMSSNPVGNYLMMNNGQGVITILNIENEPVKQFKVKEESVAINTSDLPKGQYILRVQKDNSSTVSRFFIKN